MLFGHLIKYKYSCGSHVVLPHAALRAVLVHLILVLEHTVMCIWHALWKHCFVLTGMSNAVLIYVSTLKPVKNRVRELLLKKSERDGLVGSPGGIPPRMTM